MQTYIFQTVSTIFTRFHSSKYQRSLTSGGRQLYQYNEDEFIKALIVIKLFSNFKFTSNQSEVFLIDSFSYLLYLCVSMLLNSLI